MNQIFRDSEDILSQGEKILMNFYNNDIVSSMLTIFLVLYGGKAVKSLPDNIVNLFKVPIFRILSIALTAIVIGAADISTALMASVSFILTLTLIKRLPVVGNNNNPMNNSNRNNNSNKNNNNNRKMASNNNLPNAKVGIIQQKKIEVDGYDIVIGMLHSLVLKEYDSEIFEDFGFCIIDEVHHLGAETFSKVFKKTNIEYVCGLTATPNREDKLEKIIYWHIGNILYLEKADINQQININLCGFNCNDELFKVVINNRTKNAQMSTMITNISNIKSRTNTIINFVIKIKKNEPLRKILILSERLEHLDEMMKLIEIYNISVSKYIGGMSEKNLEKSEAADIILSTYQMSSEGLDIPTLNTIVLSTSRKNVEQSVGRILRKQSGHAVIPLIIDIIDNIKQFKNQSSIRKRYYKKITKEENFKNFKNLNENFELI